MTQQLQALTVAKLDDMAPLGINKACVEFCPCLIQQILYALFFCRPLIIYRTNSIEEFLECQAFGSRSGPTNAWPNPDTNCLQEISAG